MVSFGTHVFSIDLLIDQLVVVGNTLLVVYSLRSGKELWNITIKEK